MQHRPFVTLPLVELEKKKKEELMEGLFFVARPHHYLWLHALNMDTVARK